MPFQVTDPELETKLSRHAKAQPVPSSKSRLAVAIINATLSAADAEGVDAGQIIRRLLSPPAGVGHSNAIAA